MLVTSCYLHVCVKKLKKHQLDYNLEGITLFKMVRDKKAFGFYKGIMYSEMCVFFYLFINLSVPEV
jgi:hypothetical protein